MVLEGLLRPEEGAPAGARGAPHRPLQVALGPQIHTHQVDMEQVPATRNKKPDPC